MIQLTPEVRQCDQTSLECYRVCLETLNYSLQKGGRFAEAGPIRMLLDCADICQANANLMSRGSKYNLCETCARVCQECAQACERFGDDAQMKACAEACRRCATACQRMG